MRNQLAPASGTHTGAQRKLWEGNAVERKTKEQEERGRRKKRRWVHAHLIIPNPKRSRHCGAQQGATLLSSGWRTSQG